MSYYGWNSSYSGTNSTSKAIASGTHTYYVMDSAGKKGTCKIEIVETSSTNACPSGYETGSFVSNNVVYPCRNYSCAAPPCRYYYSDFVKSYVCSSGYTKVSDSYCYR